MLEINENRSENRLSVLTRPNCSMSGLGTVYLLMIMAFVMLVIALGFSLIGAWPVILFSIATLIGLSLGFQQVWKGADDYERLTLQEGRLVLEYSESGKVRQHELNAHWVRVVMEDMPDGNCRRLALRAHGKHFKFGRHLCAETKSSVGLMLKTRLGSGFNKQTIHQQP